MKVTALFHGILAEWVGVKRADFELQKEALFVDVLREIGRNFRNNMPEQLWDDQQGNFASKVIAMSNGRKLKPEEPLIHGSDIAFFLMLAGG